ncbi:hypothetical protein CWIS_04475 [Cellulomonas sp. A375-1]|uniref:ribonuclease D n=1 Tax=Cellulomonas sp. A375-1 TaxID=1672219 RepID=UPI000652756D|nr:ribonuclease D [Cellulomonas sp. A375-1]KMM46560.1 hypothetical protein CWIS_04475 [Cellulomonas sp. A375-1]
MVTVVEGDLPASLALELASAPEVAWDTETSGLEWRSDRLNLCQLHAPAVGTVLVRIGEQRPERLAALLSDPGVVKVFHHAPFDLRFMRVAWDARASNVRCTKVASKLLSPDAPSRDHSLAHLVWTHLQVRLAKGVVRTSDWSARELSDAQVEYAAGDVEYLLPLHRMLHTELESADLSAVYERCCSFLPTQVDVTLMGITDVFAY